MAVFLLLKEVNKVSIGLEMVFKDGFYVVPTLLKVSYLIHVKIYTAKDFADECFEVAGVHCLFYILAIRLLLVRHVGSYLLIWLKHFNLSFLCILLHLGQHGVILGLRHV